MPRVKVRIHKMSNGKIEVSCEALHQPHSRPYDTAAETKATLLRLGVPTDAADAYLAQLQGGEWINVGEYQVEDSTLKDTGFTAV